MATSAAGRYALYGHEARAAVSIGLLLLCFAVGAGAIALWLYVRFGSGRFAPANLRAALIHVGASLVVGQLAVPALMKVLLAAGSPAVTLIGIFAVAFPALVYCLLASIWVITMLQGSLRHR
jgi:hypothetical protein